MKEGWICPKCGRIWGPDIWGCQECNKAIQAPVKVPISHEHNFGWDGDGWTCSVCGLHTTSIPITRERWEYEYGPSDQTNV